MSHRFLPFQVLLYPSSKHSFLEESPAKVEEGEWGLDPCLPTLLRRERTLPLHSPFPKPPPPTSGVCRWVCFSLRCEKTIAEASSPPSSWQEPDTNFQPPRRRPLTQGSRGRGKVMPSKIQLGITRGPLRGLRFSPRRWQKTLHSLLVTTTAYRFSLPFMASLSSLS